MQSQVCENTTILLYNVSGIEKLNTSNGMVNNNSAIKIICIYLEMIHFLCVFVYI